MIEISFFENYLPITYIAEFIYCPRGAVYMYFNWENNLKNKFLYEGYLYHKKIKSYQVKHRKNKLQRKNILLFNNDLKIYGFCDVVEFTFDKIYPVEYKSGLPRINDFNKSQLLLQCLCLEYMFNKKVEGGYIYFYKINKRFYLKFDTKFRNFVINKIFEFKSIIEKIKKTKIIGSSINLCNKRGCSYYQIFNF
ncbi:MAG: CRISPR-associated protein Cas4 [Patescibacteria group bacterium]|nr:CRISPR-associated protein Cas4 [Patescibacteria group bacterium]